MHHVRHAAAGRADVDAPAGELGEAGQLGRVEQPLGGIGAIEDPDRLVEQAAEGHLAVVGDIALVAARRRPSRRRRPGRRRCRPRRRARAAAPRSRPRRRSHGGGPRCRFPSAARRSACRTRRTRPGPARSPGPRFAAASDRATNRPPRAAPPRGQRTESRWRTGRAARAASREGGDRAWPPLSLAPRPAQSRPILDRMRLLLVEDDRMIGESLQRTLRLEGYRGRLGPRRRRRRRHARQRALRPRAARPRPAARRRTRAAPKTAWPCCAHCARATTPRR